MKKFLAIVTMAIAGFVVVGCADPCDEARTDCEETCTDEISEGFCLAAVELCDLPLVDDKTCCQGLLDSGGGCGSTDD